MADPEQQKGGPSTPSTARRRRSAAKAKPQPSSDWPRTSEPRPRASPRRKRHGDIDMDIVESSDDDDDSSDAKASSRKPQPRRRRPQPQQPASSSTESDTTTPTKSTPQRSSMRLPNAPVPVVNTARAPSRHRRPTYVYEEDDDDDDEDDDDPPRRPSRPVSRQAVSRRDVSTHRYRSTPESRRSPRTSVSDSEDDTKVTSDSEEEQVIEPPRNKHHLPPAPIAPAVPPAPPAPAIHSSLQERLSRQPEVEYEEPDSTSKYAPSVGRHRSRSRAPSSMRDDYRRPRDISISRPTSADEARSRSRSRRRPSRHYGSDVYVSRPSSSYKRPHVGAGSQFASSHSLGSSKRSTFFGDAAAPPAPAAPSAPPAPSVHPSHSGKSTKRLTTCIVCRDGEVTVDKTVKLRCRHRICHSCLRRVFKLSLTDPQHMPPRCCTADHIPLKYVEKLFDADFKREWNQKYLEYTSRSRLYCPSRRCGEWIRPEDIRREGGRRHAKCSRCSTKVCASCSGKWHHPSECPGAQEPTQFPGPAKREAWQRCHRCKAVIELKEGCSHMTCRCGAEFCITCGAKWKTCECPWLRHEPFEGDAVNPALGSMSARPNPFLSEPPYDPGPASPRDIHSDFGPLPAAAARPRPSSYEEEAYLRRLQEQRDEHLARRMHSFDAFGHHGGHADHGRGRRDYDLDRPPRDSRRRPDFRGHGASFGDEDYHRRAATVVAPSPPQTHVPTAPPPPRSAFDPPSRPAFDRPAMSVFEYGSGLPPDRGRRYASPERYDDDYMEDYVPEPRRRRSPDRWHAFSHERRPRTPDRPAFPPAAESRPHSPETWQQLPTRYPSPERPMPALERHMSVTEERRRAPSPERRRATSLERRLADRFRPESRQSPAGPPVPVGPVGPLGPLGPVGPLGPLSPTRGAAPPPPRAATYPAVPGPVAGMPLAPIPPPGAPPAMPRRHTSMDQDVHLPGPGGMMHGPPPFPGPADWFGPPPGLAGGGLLPGMGMGMHDMDNGAGHGSPRAPNVRRRPPGQGQAIREHTKFDVPRSSVLAGLGGLGRGVHRVSEWVNFVEPGLPDGEQARTVVQ